MVKWCFILVIQERSQSQSHQGVSLLLVGDFNPSEKYARQNGFIFPNFRVENKTYLKPPHRLESGKYPQQSNRNPNGASMAQKTFGLLSSTIL